MQRPYQELSQKAIIEKYSRLIKEASTICKKIRLYRNMQQIPQYVLAGKAGISPVTLSKIERGKPPTPQQLARIKEVFANTDNRCARLKDFPFFEK